MGRLNKIECAAIGKARMPKSKHEDMRSVIHKVTRFLVRMAMPDDKDTNKDPADKGKGPKKLPAKIIKMDELEVSIKKVWREPCEMQLRNVVHQRERCCKTMQEVRKASTGSKVLPVVLVTQG